MSSFCRICIFERHFPFFDLFVCLFVFPHLAICLQYNFHHNFHLFAYLLSLAFRGRGFNLHSRFCYPSPHNFRILWRWRADTDQTGKVITANVVITYYIIYCCYSFCFCHYCCSRCNHCCCSCCYFPALLLLCYNCFVSATPSTLATATATVNVCYYSCYCFCYYSCSITALATVLTTATATPLALANATVLLLLLLPVRLVLLLCSCYCFCYCYSPCWALLLLLEVLLLVILLLLLLLPLLLQLILRVLLLVLLYFWCCCCCCCCCCFYSCYCCCHCRCHFSWSSSLCYALPKSRNFHRNCSVQNLICHTQL